jgi:hypothetical protein
MPEVTTVDTPIVIFISSRQKEFEQARHKLKEAIETLKTFNRLPMKAELVERRGGSRLRRDIMTALDASAIYVGIFGNEFSETTQWEFQRAMRRGLVPLIFDVIPSKGSQNKRDDRVRKFLDEVRASGIRTVAIVGLPPRPSGRASLDPRYHKLIDPVMARIINEIAEMVGQNLEIRKKLLATE